MFLHDDDDADADDARAMTIPRLFLRNTSSFSSKTAELKINEKNTRRLKFVLLDVKQIFTGILEKFSYFIMSICFVCTH